MNTKKIEEKISEICNQRGISTNSLKRIAVIQYLKENFGVEINDEKEKNVKTN